MQVSGHNHEFVYWLLSFVDMAETSGSKYKAKARPAKHSVHPSLSKMKSPVVAIALLATSINAGPILWSGLFNSSATVADFDKWSWSNEIQPWQWYIHGSEPTADYLALSPNYKNPADASDAQGIRTTINPTSTWNSDFWRTEIIPQTSANLGTGHLYYHFSLMTSTTNPPNPGFEHQIAFFESHFTEIKYGLISGEAGTTDNTLRWDIGGVTKWSTQLVPGTWYNFAYDIDFSASTVSLWQSSGSADLTQVFPATSASTSTNSEDWHIGLLRLDNGGSSTTPEDWYWSGIFVESGPITTSVTGSTGGKTGSSTTSGSSTSTGSSSSSSSSSSHTSSGSSSTTSTTTVTSTSSHSSTTSSTTSSAPSQQTKYGQCGGTGYTGPTSCAPPATCSAVSPPYYYQCL